MKRITTLIFMSVMVILGSTAYAQIDEQKMDRDLRVASGVLESLMNKDNDHMFRGGEPEGNYVEGYGVIFTIQDNMLFRYNYKVNWEVARDAQREAARAMKEAQMAQREQERALREAQRAMAESETLEENEDTKPPKSPKPLKEPKPIKEPKGSTVIVVPDVDIDVDLEDIEQKMKESEAKMEAANAEFNKDLHQAFETFLVEYSQLIGQLKPTDKILLTTKSSEEMVFAFGDDKDFKQKSRLSAEMLVKDHQDYQAGKLTKDNLLKKIKFIENAELERKPDLDLFGNMIKTTYDQRYTESYFISSTPSYEWLSGLGAVYTVKVYSSFEDNGKYRMPGIKQSDMSKEEREKSVQELYPKFVDSFKENMIRFGSTIKSLKDGNKLIIKVKMTSCDSCSFPDTIEFTVDKSVLDQFSNGSLSLDQAKNKVILKN